MKFNKGICEVLYLERNNPRHKCTQAGKQLCRAGLWKFNVSTRQLFLFSNIHHQIPHVPRTSRNPAPILFQRKETDAVMYLGHTHRARPRFFFQVTANCKSKLHFQNMVQNRFQVHVNTDGLEMKTDLLLDSRINSNSSIL